MKYIKVHLYSERSDDKLTTWINPNQIQYIKEPGWYEKEFNKGLLATIVLNNGFLQVHESPEQILKMIYETRRLSEFT